MYPLARGHNITTLLYDSQTFYGGAYIMYDRYLVSNL